METGKRNYLKKRLGNFLVENGLLEPADLEKALEEQKRTGKKLGEILIDLNLITEEQVKKSLAFQLGYQVVEMDRISFDPEVVFLISEHLARKHNIIPLKLENRVLTVAMVDPLDYDCIRDLSFYCGYAIEPVLASKQEIVEANNRQYKEKTSDQSKSVEDIVKESAKDFNDETLIQVVPEIRTDKIENQSLEEKSQLAPIIRLANVIISSGIKNKASDIHIEPGKQDCRIRYRVDGLLREGMRVPRWVQGALASRIKILANLDIADRRQPQDGAVRIKVENREIDLRVSVIPAQHGEKVVIRILDQSNLLTTLESLGLLPEQFSLVESLCTHRKGIILVTGPTGSGKTTTLYAMINRLRSESTNLMTVEDPIEYTIDGVNQIQINTSIDLSFAKCLRAILRQDPNVILIGEIRDSETAEIAFRAAMTGHLVLSTLHTNDAPSTIGRLLEIGIPRHLIASQVVGIMAKRLVRTLCTHCKEPIPTPEEELSLLNIPPQAVKEITFFQAKGCSNCSQTGYQGRTGIHEIMGFKPALRDSISANAPEQQIRSEALSMGMIGLRESGLQKIREGLTSVSELARVIEVEDQLQTFCQNCSKSLTIDFLICPYCGEEVLHRCQTCKKALQPEWAFCPYCREKKP